MVKFQGSCSRAPRGLQAGSINRAFVDSVDYAFQGFEKYKKLILKRNQSFQTPPGHTCPRVSTLEPTSGDPSGARISAPGCRVSVFTDPTTNHRYQECPRFKNRNTDAFMSAGQGSLGSCFYVDWCKSCLYQVQISGCAPGHLEAALISEL